MEAHPVNMHISGAGSIDGGVYGEIGVSGAASAKGDIVCESLRVSGSCHFPGEMNCSGEAHVSGSADVKGPLSAESLRVSGSLRVSQTVRAREMRISGSLRAGGDVEADDTHISGGGAVAGTLRGKAVRLSGSLSVEKGVECEELEMSGAFTAKGLMNAETVRIRIGGVCRADEIGGETIDVRKCDPASERAGAILAKLFSALTPERYLEVNTIEGTNVYLENTRAGVVRGGRVAIGPGCRIGRVEYGESLEADPDSEIGERARDDA